MAEEFGSWAEVWAAVGVLALVVSASGLVVRLVTVRGIDGRLDQNPAAGIRTSATMASDEAWRAGQRAGGPLTLIGSTVGAASGAIALVVSVVLWLAGAGPTTVGIVGLVAAMAGVLLMFVFVVAGAVRGHRAAAATVARDRS